MVKNSHKLSKTWDKWFLEQNRQDEYLLEEFHPGDTVVVCAQCHRVWLVDTWEMKQCCPNSLCAHRETMPFRKGQNRIHARRGSRVKIVKNKNSGFAGLYGNLEWIDKKLLIFEKKSFPYIWKGALTVSIFLSLLQFRTEQSPINGISGVYYQYALKRVETRFSYSFSDMLSDTETSVIESVETTVDLAGKTVHSTVDTLGTSVQAVSNKTKATVTAAGESLEKIKQSVLGAVEKQLNVVK